MSRSRALKIALALLLAALPARAADIPKLVEIPADVAAANPGLPQQLTQLSVERTRLRDRIQSHNMLCASVIVGSTADTACARENTKLEGEVAAHIAASNRFNAAVGALVGGMTWIVGYNNQNLAPAARDERNRCSSPVSPTTRPSTSSATTS
jgi:hypothetical protein